MCALLPHLPCQLPREAESGEVDVGGLVVQDVRAPGGRVAEVLGDFGLWDGGDVVIVEEEPGAEGLDDGDIVAVVGAAEIKD